jgi:hypothetical protein
MPVGHIAEAEGAMTAFDALCSKFMLLQDDPYNRAQRYLLVAEVQRVLSEQCNDPISARIYNQIADDYVRMAKWVNQINNSIDYIQSLNQSRIGRK